MKNTHTFYGNCPEDIKGLARTLKTGPDAATWHKYVAEEVRKLGYSVQVEFPMPYEGRSGRIDIMAFKEGIAVAIELDKLKPREKSIKKIQKCPAGAIFLRGHCEV